MKAVICRGDGIVEFKDVKDPEVTVGCVKVNVKASGICGSDIPRAMAKGAHSYPIILGHEFAGVVVEIGQGVTAVQIGDHVTVAPLIPCHACDDCKKGYFSLCKNYSFIGSRQQGANAEYVVVPEVNVVKIGKRIPFEVGALFEPSTVALHAIYLNEYKPGGNVAILGGGTIGVFTLQWAKILGAKKVAVFGRDKGHLELSRRLGADSIISTLDSDFFEHAMRLTNGCGYDYVFETAGSVFLMKYAFQIAANRAHVCFVGTPTMGLAFTPKEWQLLNRKELKLIGSWMSYSAPFPGREWTETERFFSDGSLKFDEGIFYAKYPMSKAQDAFNNFREKGKVKGRILLVND